MDGQSPETLATIYVLSPTRGQVPLSQIARYEPTLAPLSVNHQGTFAATTISFNLAEGVAMSDAAEIDPRHAWRASACPPRSTPRSRAPRKLFQQGLDNQPYLILAALLTVYIVLGILYESVVHPITILSTLPSAGVGALLALHRLQDRLLDHRADRRDPADRHREEERDPDDRLRPRSGAARRQEPARRDLRGLRCCASGRS